MVPTYNGWEDTPEEEREALDAWEAASRQAPPAWRRSRASQAIIEIYSEDVSGRRS